MKQKSVKRSMRLILIVSLCAILICVCALHVFGETVSSGKCGENLTWNLSDDGTLTVSGTGSMYSYSTYAIPWYGRSSDIKTVVIEDGVESICYYAFYHCVNLESVYIGETVEYIEARAFAYCNALRAVYFANKEGWYSEPTTYVKESSRQIPAKSLESAEEAAELLKPYNLNLYRKINNGYIDLPTLNIFSANEKTNPISIYKSASIVKINGYNGLTGGVDMGDAIALAGVNAMGDVEILTPNYGEAALEISEGYEYYLKMSSFKSVQPEIVFPLSAASLEDLGIVGHVDANKKQAYDISKYDQLTVEFFIPESTYTLDPYTFIIMLECTQPQTGRSYLYVEPTTVTRANSENGGFYTATYSFSAMDVMRTPDLASAVSVSFQFQGWNNGVNGQIKDNYDIFVKSISIEGADIIDVKDGSASCSHVNASGESAMTHVSVPSGCDVYGYSAYRCTLCGYEEIENDYSKLKAPTGHTYVVANSKEPTCTESGYSNMRCESCGAYEYVSLSKLGHHYSVKMTNDGTMLVACIRGDVINMPKMTSVAPTYNELVSQIAYDKNTKYGNISTDVYSLGYSLVNTTYDGTSATESSKRVGDLKPTVRQGSFEILSNGNVDNVNKYMHLWSSDVTIQNYINAFLVDSNNQKIDPGTDMTIEFSVRTEIKEYDPNVYNKKTFEIIDRTVSGNAFLKLCEITPQGYLSFGTNNLDYQLSDTDFTHVAISIHPISGTYDVYIEGILVGVDFKLPEGKHSDLKNLVVAEFRFNQYVTDTWTDLTNLIAYDSVCPKFVKGFQDIWTEGNEFESDGYASAEFDIDKEIIGDIDEAWLETFKNGLNATTDPVTDEEFNTSYSIETVEKDGEMVKVVNWQQFQSGSSHFHFTDFSNYDYRILTENDAEKYPLYDYSNGNTYKVYDLRGYDSVTIEFYCDTVSEELPNGYKMCVGFFSPKIAGVSNYYATFITIVPEYVDQGEDGWQTITIPFSDLGANHNADWSAISHFSIIASGWGSEGVGAGNVGSFLKQEENAVDGTVIKIKSVTLNDVGTIYYTAPDAECEHDYSIRTVVPSTCITNGYTAMKCSKCGGEAPYMASVTPLGDHNIETVIKFPKTCNSTNAQIERCLVCDARVMSRYIVLGHEYSTVVYAPTCDDSGCTVYSCYCGETYETYDIVPALGHDFADWEITKAPTYTAEGERRRICSHNSGHYISESISVLINEKVPELEYDENGVLIGSGVWFGEYDVIITDEGQVNIGMGTNGNEKPDYNSAKLVKELIKTLVDKDLSLRHDYGEIIFDEKAMKKLAKHAGDVDMVVRVITTDEEASEGKSVYSFSVSSDGVELLPESTSDENGTMSVTLFFQTGLDEKDVRVTYRAPNGETYDVSVKNYNPITGEVTFDTEHFSEFELSVVPSDGTEIKSASISIGADLTLNIYAALSEARKDASVRFTMNGKSVTVDSSDVSSAGYKFAFKGITPQCMNDIVTIELMHDGHVVDAMDYSIRTYCDAIIALDAESLNISEEKYEALTVLIADMLEYGAESQIYRGYKLYALANEGISGKSEFDAILESDTKLVESKNEKGVAFKSATMLFSNANQLYFSFTAPDISKISIMLVVDGTSKMYSEADFVEYESGVYMVASDDLYAVDYDDIYTVVLMYNGKIVQNLTYSVRSYVYSMQNTSNSDGSLTNMAKLSRALWCYGCSAKTYKATE